MIHISEIIIFGGAEQFNVYDNRFLLLIMSALKCYELLSNEFFGNI